MLVLAGAALALWPNRSAPQLSSTTTSASRVPPPVVSPAPAPTPVLAPAPLTAAAPATWLAHRDNAVNYANHGQHAAALQEVEAALEDDAAAASSDPALAQAAVNAFDRARVAFVIDAFRSNPQLIAALVHATAEATTSEQRHAAHEGLRLLGEEARADLVAMQILDFAQAATCPAMRNAFKQLRASTDPRIQKLRADLRSRGRKDRHTRCLKRMLRR
jgi:hypothetical protein